MKVSKNGKVKLEKGEVRIGNFFVKKEEKTEHLKIQDLSSVFSLRVWNRIPLGIWLNNIVDMGEKGAETIKTYIATIWSLLSVVPDDQFITELLDSTRACLQRHPLWYGDKENPTEEEDAEAVTAVREMKEFEEDVKKFVENADTPAPTE